MVAEVTVFPVPGGPWIRLSGLCSTVLTAYTFGERAVVRLQPAPGSGGPPTQAGSAGQAPSSPQSG